jgi:hypothetical protein
MLMDDIKKNYNFKERPKTKITIKRMRIEFDIKIK